MRIIGKFAACGAKFFHAAETAQTATALLLYALGLFTYSAVKIVVPTYYALGDTWTPVWTSATTIAVKIALNFVLIAPVFGLTFQGLALATSVAAALNFILLIARLRGRLGPGPAGTTTGIARIAVAAALMGVACAAIDAALEALWPAAAFAARSVKLVVAIGAGIGIYVGFAHLLRVPELSETLQLLRRRRTSDRSA